MGDGTLYASAATYRKSAGYHYGRYQYPQKTYGFPQGHVRYQQMAAVIVLCGHDAIFSIKIINIV
jgi:hypothetical protein